VYRQTHSRKRDEAFVNIALELFRLAGREQRKVVAIVVGHVNGVFDLRERVGPGVVDRNALSATHSHEAMVPSFIGASLAPTFRHDVWLLPSF
jgi:hypothetical protein